jgi:hypothetical protein
MLVIPLDAEMVIIFYNRLFEKKSTVVTSFLACPVQILFTAAMPVP